MSENRENFDAMEDIADTAELNAENPSDTGEQEELPDSAEAPKKPFSDAMEWASSLVYAVLIMLVLNLFVFRSITVSGESMNNTLSDQDRIIATNLFYTPKRGDIVVIQSDRIENRALSYTYGYSVYGEPIIKRVIGLAGDTVRFDFEKGEVYLNGELLEEDYIAAPTYAEWNMLSGRDYVVPDGHVFVMGDNRNASTDSRAVQVGYVDTDLIMGKAVFRFGPFENMGLL